MNFYEKLKHAAQLNRSLVCVGLDPDLKKLPACLAGKKNPKQNASAVKWNRHLKRQPLI